MTALPTQAIQYLSADYQPTAQQSEPGITQLTRSLAPYGLTKAEKLQIVNLAPTEPVELYVVGVMQNVCAAFRLRRVAMHIGGRRA